MRKYLGVWVLVPFLALSLSPAAAPPVPAVDDHGDPLPQAAVARLGTLRWRTGVHIQDLACSPNGKWLATADYYLRTARLWDAATGQVLRTFWGHREQVVAVAFSPDSKRLLTAGVDKSVRVWDVTTGEPLRKFDLPMVPRQGGLVAQAAGFVVLDASSQLIRYDADGKVIGRAKFAAIYHLSLASRGGHVLTAVAGRQGGRTLRVSTAGGEQVCEIACDDFAEAAISPDGKRVAVRLRKPAVKVYDAESGKEVRALPADEVGKFGGALSFSPDGKRLLGEVERGKLRLWEVETGKRLVEFAGANHNARVRAFSPDGGRLVIVSYGMALRVFDVARGARLNATDEAEGPLRSVAFSPNGNYLLAAGLDEAVRLWDVAARRVVRRLRTGVETPAGFNGVAFSPDSKRAAAVGYGQPVVVWDIPGGKELHRFTIDNPLLNAVLFSADGDTLFAASVNAGVLRWDLKTGKQLPALKGQPPRSIAALQLSRDGKTLVASSWVPNVNGTSTFWDVATGTEQRTVTVPSFSQWLTSDGKKLVGVDGRGKVNFHDATDGKLADSWQGGNALSLRLSPDDRFLATTYRRLLRLYDAAGGHSRPVVVDFDGLGAVAMAQALAHFSPDSKRLAVCDGPCVLLYDVKTLRHAPEYRLAPGQWRWCWEVLGEKPPHHASEAQSLLHAAGGTWVGAARRLLTPPPVDAKRVATLLEGVTGEDREAADRAVQELVKLGAGVRLLIDQALESTPDVDVKLKLRVARSKVPGPDPAEESFRAPRLVAVLRQVGTKDAKALLEDMAAGKFGSRWEKAAKAKP